MSAREVDGEERCVVSVPSNWWENFFEGVAVDLWLHGVPAEYTEREVETLVRTLGVPTGAEILDVPCGAGRLALPLAECGYKVTGVDWSAEFLDHARSRDTERQVSWEQRDMRDLPWRERFDGAFCAGNSFGYLDDEGNVAVLRAVAAALKPGARFVLETPMLLENLLRNLHDRAWWKVGGIYFLVQNTYDPARQRRLSDAFGSVVTMGVCHGLIDTGVALWFRTGLWLPVRPRARRPR